MIFLTPRSSVFMTLEGRGFAVAFLPGTWRKEIDRTDGCSCLDWVSFLPLASSQLLPTVGTHRKKAPSLMLCIPLSDFPWSSLSFPSPACCSCHICHCPVSISTPSFWLWSVFEHPAVLLLGGLSPPPVALLAEQCNTWKPFCALSILLKWWGPEVCTPMPSLEGCVLPAAS